MALTACPVVGKTKSIELCNAFVTGAPKTAVGCVFYGVNDTNHAQWKKAQRLGVPCWYIDNAYFDSTRHQQFRVTKNAFQIQARNLWSDGKRFDALGLVIKPVQRNVDGHWVLIEQSPSFMKTMGASDWFHRTLLWAEVTGRKVKVRRWSAKKMELQATLPEDLKGAWGLLAHTSAAAVTAALEGIPCIVEKEHALAGVRVTDDNSTDGRRAAFNVLADYQFTLQELKDGTAWTKVGS